MGSQENYFRSVGQQNNNNPQFKGGQMKNKNIDH